MNDRQITIFDVIDNKPFNDLREKLSKYIIDDVYLNEFAGRYVTFGEIERRLMNLQNYNEYIKELFNVLKEYIPVINKKTASLTTGMYFDCNSIRIHQLYQEYTIYCLEMLDKKIFKEFGYE